VTEHEWPEVVVTGVGAVSSLGTGADALYLGWMDGRTGIRDGVARASDFDPGVRMSVKEVRRADRVTQLATVAADEALAAAGWVDGSPYDPFRVATVVGTGIGGITTHESQWSIMASGEGRLSPLGVPMMMPNAPAASLSMRYGFHGPAIGTVSACAAGADAIGTALRMLRYGEMDAVITGGTESAITDYSLAAFKQMGALSKLGISRPFDARRDGFVLGEGAGILVLERKADALRRGAPIVGVLRGYGATSDAFHLTAPDPSGIAAAAAIKSALSDARVTPAELCYINAHGTSTPLNDSAEANALRAALGPVAGRIPVSSTKSAIGHLLGAGGAVEAVATLLTLKAGVAPANLGYGETDPDIADLDLISGEPRSLTGPGGIAISNSFGFGGHNSVLCLEVP
jgi:3-oxoacyl-[acyl-carrier-protein] synthase II